MKIRGKQVSPPSPVRVEIYREDEQGRPDNIVFTCGAVLDYTTFNQLCPLPTPPLVTDIQSGTSHSDMEDKRYNAKVRVYSERRFYWMFIQSLSFTSGLEWEKVDLTKPDTWSLYDQELDTFLTRAEKERLIEGCVEANSPTQNRRKEALENFTSTQEAQASPTTISPVDEPTITPSGELVSV